MMNAEPLIVTRTIAVNGDAAHAAQALAAVPGVRSAEAGGRSVTVAYDLHRLRLAAVEQALAAAGTPPRRGFAGAWRRAMARFTEDNLLANADAEPHCCCKPPKGKE